jgi:protein involved in polysaccharide export with SLBB domain
MLRPGDEIKVKFRGENEFDFDTTIDEDGKIVFDQREVVAKCRTERGLADEIKVMAGKYLRSPSVTVNAAKKNIPKVTVYGEVQRPESFELHRRATLAELLAFAGGPKEEAGGTVQIFRTQAPPCADSPDERWEAGSTDPTEAPSRIYSLANVRTGTPEANPVIHPGDLIFVHRAAPVYITGEVMAPQGVYIKEGGLTLSEAIAKVSGFGREANLSDVKVFRLKSGSKDRETISANFKLIREQKQKDILLEPNDIVAVGRAKDPLGVSILKFIVGAGKTAVSSLSTNAGYRVIY